MQKFYILIFIFLSSCTVLRHTNNKKSYKFNLTKDGYKKYLIDEKNIEALKNSPYYLNEKNKTNYYKEITKKEVDSTIHSNQQIAIILWNICSQVNQKVLSLVDRCQKNNIDYLILCLDYDLKNRKNILANFNINTNFYFLSNKEYGSKNLLKQIEFYRTHDNKIYTKYKDDVHYFYVVTYKAGNATHHLKLEEIDNAKKQDSIIKILK